jgi:hypothetical protein
VGRVRGAVGASIPGDRETLWGGRRGNGNFVAASNRWSASDTPAERLEQVPRRCLSRAELEVRIHSPPAASQVRTLTSSIRSGRFGLSRRRKPTTVKLSIKICATLGKHGSLGNGVAGATDSRKDFLTRSRRYFAGNGCRGSVPGLARIRPPKSRKPRVSAGVRARARGAQPRHWPTMPLAVISMRCGPIRSAHIWRIDQQAHNSARQRPCRQRCAPVNYLLAEAVQRLPAATVYASFVGV